MTILALEFSSERRSVALSQNGAVVTEAVEQTGGRGTNAFALIEKVLAQTRISRAEIGTIAVGLGPGSYTGIRAAIAIAQGWQLASGVKLLGVSSAESIAAQAQSGKILGRVNVVIDAQRGEFYLATWEIAVDERKEISPLKIVPAAEIRSRQDAGEICLGPEMTVKTFPGAAMVARLASGRTGFLPGEQLEPIYLREASFVKSPPPRLVV
jgi:tRNA threonylcarbamoyladenosine biosynthesis protein TsaB